MAQSWAGTDVETGRSHGCTTGRQPSQNHRQPETGKKRAISVKAHTTATSSSFEVAAALCQKKRAGRGAVPIGGLKKSEKVIFRKNVDVNLAIAR